MKRNPTRYLLLLLSICLVLGESLHSTSTYASQASFGEYLLRFFEIGPEKLNGSQRPVLMFGVRGDGSVFLAILRKLPDANDNDFRDEEIIWREDGKLTFSDLNRIKIAQRALIGVPDQNWPGKDYAIDRESLVTGPENTRLLLNDQLSPGSPAARASLENTVQIILGIRKRFEPLVVFKWSGAFGRRSSLLTMRADGTLLYEDAMRGISAADRATQPQMDLVQQQINSESFLAFASAVKPNCGDCWAYSLTSITESGLKTSEFDQGTLESSPVPLKTLVTLLADLSDQEAVIGPTLTPLPTSTPTSTLRPTVQPTAMPTRTPFVNAKPVPSPAPEKWETVLRPGEDRIEIIVLDSSNQVQIGAVKGFQLQPGQPPQECAAFVIRGPMALMLGVFGPGVVEQRDGMTDAMIEARLHEGVELLSRYCDRDKIKMVRVP